MTTTPSTTRLAVLIDADNTSPKHVSALLEELATYGVATVKRAYGDWTTPQLGGWKAELNRHAIVPVQQFAYTTGKNATDSALIIDAMDLLYSGNLEAFALVSSDSDFTRLATRLRESGKTVYGLGLRKTPQSLVAACDTFIYLEVLGRGAVGGPEEGAEEGAEPAAPLPNLQSLLSRAVNATSDDDGWSHLSAIGKYLRSADSSFDPRLYGAAKLATLVEGQAYLTTTGSGSGVKVGLKGQTTPVTKPVTKPVAKAVTRTATATRTTAAKTASKRTTRKAAGS
ncbi:NYN domain-containing protein [Nocardioides humi]|uniref:HTH OST-type domain-containing protein n=1 Tax=Nocardioides humi TaxID=449461 RepID=A0ABN2AXC1_9ACTN|nr:NYN domain-containing protein [Nocardioides humi]